MIRPLIILFILGALQGAVGWIMVASGLTGDAIYVKPTRLALHFVFAMVLLGYTFWFALKLLVHKSHVITAPRFKQFTWWIIGILLLQFVFGALMAGHRAAPAAPTWPDINGSFIPDHLFTGAGGWRRLIEDRIVIHFIHRMLAYTLVVLILLWTVWAFRIKRSGLFKKTRLLPFFFVLLQLTLGIYTVLTSVHIRVAKWNIFEWMAQLHQFIALLLLLSLVLAAFLVRRRSLVY
jgi:cytochrome c oxidase assembly protein subunit 15